MFFFGILGFTEMIFFFNIFLVFLGFAILKLFFII